MVGSCTSASKPQLFETTRRVASFAAASIAFSSAVSSGTWVTVLAKKYFRCDAGAIPCDDSTSSAVSTHALSSVLCAPAGLQLETEHGTKSIPSAPA